MGTWKRYTGAFVQKRLSESGNAQSAVCKWLRGNQLRENRATPAHPVDGPVSLDGPVSRGIAIGRHNWTFLGSDSGGHTAAVLRSFTGSCQLIGVEPFAWFRDVLARINSHPINRLHELLPPHWAAARP